MEEKYCDTDPYNRARGRCPFVMVGNLPSGIKILYRPIMDLAGKLVDAEYLGVLTDSVADVAAWAMSVETISKTA